MIKGFEGFDLLKSFFSILSQVRNAPPLDGVGAQDGVEAQETVEGIQVAQEIVGGIQEA